MPRPVGARRLVHVLPDGEEVDYATPPADVPMLLVTVIRMRANYIEEYTLTHLCVDVESDRARIGRARAGTAGAMTAPMAVVRGG
jgi:hypothetical protein